MAEMTKKTKKKKSTKAKKKISPPEKSISEPVGTSPVVPYPTAGKKIIDFENTLDNQLSSNPESPKKRGRPRKDQTQQPEPEITLDEKIISQAMKVPFDLWAGTNNLSALKLTDAESQTIAGPVKQLLDYYLPKVPTIAVAWISLAVTSWAIMSARLALIAKVKKQKTESSSESEPAQGENQGRNTVANKRNVNAPAPVIFPAATKPVQV